MEGVDGGNPRGGSRTHQSHQPPQPGETDLSIASRIHPLEIHGSRTILERDPGVITNVRIEKVKVTGEKPVIGASAKIIHPLCEYG
ncbi:hypothetical protein TNIN_247251 [Trichonephila inaurata madagascariensis]|uniref:Uncharacterized protein n=1 Tax=Trichonephila inaurata madagascariensis TaxID=2747483 RepID=A0A8X6YGL3_9ARAC|nr:hypothetical protein TNIN_247251 [Trichonephila inaurata madagascariensis]